MANGYIKLHRSILDWEWFRDQAVYKVFTFLLLTAKWDDCTERGVTLKAGQLITSRAKLAREIGLTESEIRTALDKLKLTNEITSEIANNKNVITIVNWAFYQSGDENIASELPADSPRDLQASASLSPKNGVSSYYIRNKETKNINDQIFGRFWSAYPRKEAKQAAKKAFAKIKPEEALLEIMIAALERQKKSAAWLKDKGQFIPHASTWLNGRRKSQKLSDLPQPANELRNL
jgi:hypothetical protein